MEEEEEDDDEDDEKYHIQRRTQMSFDGDVEQNDKEQCNEIHRFIPRIHIKAL